MSFFRPLTAKTSLHQSLVASSLISSSILLSSLTWAPATCAQTAAQPDNNPPATAPPAQPAQPGLPAQPQGDSPAQQAEAKLFKNANGQPLVLPPLTFVDINSGRFGKLEIDLLDAQFLDAAVDKLHLIAGNMDLNTGVLKSLNIDVQGGHYQDFIFDELSLDSQGDLKFDPGVLLNHKTLEFTAPVGAHVTAIVSQKGLNEFLSSPKTLERLSVSANKRVAQIASLLGAGNLGNFGLNLTQASVALKKGNHVDISLTTKLGMGNMGVPLNLDMHTKLDLVNGSLQLVDTKINTNGAELPPQISEMLVKKVNELTSIGQSNDIHFSFTELKVLANNKFILKGTAQINRLRFGRN